MVLLVPPALPPAQGTAITIVSVTAVTTPFASARKMLQQPQQQLQQPQQQLRHQPQHQGGEGRMLLASGGVVVVYVVASPAASSSALTQVSQVARHDMK